MQAITFKIVQIVDGQWVVTEPTDIYAWAAANDRKASYIPDRSARYLREFLRNQPRIQGFCGPTFDGYATNGDAVVRYESQQANDIISA